MTDGYRAKRGTRAGGHGAPRCSSFLNEWSNMLRKRSSPIRALAVKIETKLLNWWSRNKYYHKINPIDLKLIQSIAYQIKTLWLCSIIGSITSVTLNNLINIVTSHKSSPYHSTQSFEHQISFFPQIHVNQELYLLFINTAMPQRLVELRDDKSFYHKDYERKRGYLVLVPGGQTMEPAMLWTSH